MVNELCNEMNDATTKHAIAGYLKKSLSLSKGSLLSEKKSKAKEGKTKKGS
jgi:hypothetical protein